MDIKAAAAAYNSIAGITQNSPIANAGEKQKVADPSFAELVSKALGNAVDNGYKAEKAGTLAMTGKADLTQLVTAVSEAELALNTVVAIRDKIISAYQQVTQMPL